MTRGICATACSLLAALAAAPAAQAAERIVLKRAPGLTAAERSDIRADADVRLDHTLGLPGIEVVLAGRGDRAEALRELRADPDVLWAEPDRLRYAAGDPFQHLQWGLHNTGQNVWNNRGTPDVDIDAPEAWAVTRGAGVTVAVVDSGVDAGHPDLQPRLLPGYDFVDDDTDPTDLDGHGTHVAGTVAAADDGTGAVGVAPEADLVSLRVLDENGQGYGSDVAAAFDWAGDHGIPVVNASLGSASITTAEQEAIQEHPGTLFVVAAGNDEADVDATPRYPCAYPEPNVLCVGATDQDDALAEFSNYGADNVDLFAPGVNIVSAFPRGMTNDLTYYFETGDGFELMNGTSMATPHVAGAAALVAAANPGFGAEQIKDQLLASADPVPGLAGLAQVGGRLNAASALGAPAPAPTDTTAPVKPDPGSSAAGVQEVALDWPDVADDDLAGYRIYRRTERLLWSALPVAQPATSDAVITGLTGGQAVMFGVAAVDSAGNESAVRALPLATPTTPAAAVSAPAPTPTPTPAPPPPVTTVVDTPVPTPTPPVVTAPAPATVSGLKLSGRVVVCATRRCRSRAGTLRFTSSAPTRLDVALSRKGSRRVTRTKMAVNAGSTRWKVSKTVAGLYLKAGRYTLTLTAPGGPARISFTVRGR